MQLKIYQQKAIDKLKEYLLLLKEHNPKFSFLYLTEQKYQDDFFGPKIPFIGIKIPTGGGKTLVGCHSVTEILNSFLTQKMDRGILLWFVPSDAIKSQTLKKFKDRKDIHRQVLDDYFDNNVKIFSNEEALRITKGDVENNQCIIISSLDAFRKENQKRENYKVYQENGALINHFEKITDEKVLEKDENGTVINSLANLIRQRNPLIVIDEGHKSKTKLSIDFLRDLNPSFVLEFSATPRPESNILVEIHSNELKAEDMVKLPLVLQSHAQWQNAVSQGVLRREELEKTAKKDNDYIRPIALIQAQSDKNDEKDVTVFRIKDYLINEKKIPEDEIAVAYRDVNEISELNLTQKNCKIRHIITVNKLAEGWDCSFAYVLISVANIGSPIAVEQIIGRIMRMPFTVRRKNEDLNRSYVFASARNFNEAADRIIKGLETHGFSKHDLISDIEKSNKNLYDTHRKFKKEFGVPSIVLNDEPLTFENLVGEDFELSKQDASFSFVFHNDNDGRAIIDVGAADEWRRGSQQILNLTYSDRTLSKKDLVQWLDKKLRFTILEKPDKVKFIEKALDNISGSTIQELSINRFALRDALEKKINGILEKRAVEKFETYQKNGKIQVKTIKNFPESISLTGEIPQEFNKSYYDKIDKLNKEELRFVERLDLDSLPNNIEFWVRNREKQDFFLQGWQKNKFYPDFLALTKKGNILVLEWKGEDRKTNDDTKYKEKLGKTWEKLGKEKLHFFLVTTDNVDECLNKIKSL